MDIFIVFLTLYLTLAPGPGTCQCIHSLYCTKLRLLIREEKLFL